MSAFVYALRNADAMRVDGSPLIDGFDYDCDDRFVTFKWVDGKKQFEVVISPREAATAELKGNRFILSAVGGDLVTVELFKLEPSYPLPPRLSSGWMDLFYKADQEKIVYFAAMKAVMDSVVDTFIGGHSGAAANNGGYMRQIEALYAACRGNDEPIICGLSRRLSEITGFSKGAWSSVLQDSAFDGSLRDVLEAQSKL